MNDESTEGGRRQDRLKGELAEARQTIEGLKREVADTRQTIEGLETEVVKLSTLLSLELRGDGMLLIESGVSSTTGEPFVHIRWGELSGQLTVEQARGHALNVLACADGAEFDAAFLGFAQEALSMDVPQAAAFVAAMRRARGVRADVSAASADRPEEDPDEAPGD